MGIDILGVDGCSHIFQVDSFDKDFCASIGKDKKMLISYRKRLRRRLKILEDNGKNATNGYQFEFIEENLYSIRFPESKLNPRVLYAFISDDDMIILLTAFLEKNASDYEFGKVKARNIMRALKEEFES